MTRRYTDVEPIPVEALLPGDQVVIRRTVESLVWTRDTITVTWDDGTVTTYDLAQKPALEIVKRPEEQE